MSSTEQFSLCWDNFHKNMSSGMHSLLETEDLVDVTLAVEGRYLKAHKMVLSVCSPYFRELFKTNPCQHPIVFMKDVSYQALNDLLQFMYQGEVQVLQENLGTFIKTAEALQIKGLTNDSANTDDVPDSDKPPGEKTLKRPFDSDEFKVTTTRVKRTIGPASKKTKSEMSRPEVSSTPSTDVVEFKMEPYDTTDNGNVSKFNQEDSINYVDDNNDEGTDDHEDYSLIEGNVDDPQAGTSSETAGDNQGLMTLPEKSIDRYMKEYKVFCNWREENHIVGVNEMAMLAFFEDQYKNSKPSCLWVYYAMVRRCLLIYENIDIKRYLVCSEVKRLGCKARAILPVGADPEHIRITKMHSHPPDENATIKDEFIKQLRIASQSMPGSLKKVYETISLLYDQEENVVSSRKIKPNQDIPRFIVDGFVFHVNNIKGDSKVLYLRCLEYKRLGCHARAIMPHDGTIENIVIKKTHNHPPDYTAEEKIIFLQEIKETMLKNPNLLAKEVYKNLSEVYPNAAREIPFEHIHQKMNRWRKLNLL